MTVEFTLPDIGEGLHEAEIVRWMVSEGQEVARNQPFVEIMTDKSSVEMPAPAGGVVTRLVPAEGELVKVGDLLIVIEDGAGDGAQPVQAVQPAQAVQPVEARPNPLAARAPAATTPPPSAPPSGSEPVRRPKASPSTRRMAARLSVDLGQIVGTGPGGRILADDVVAASAADRSASTANQTQTRAETPTPTPGTAPVPAHPAAASPDVADALASEAGDPSGPRLGWMPTGTHPLRGIRRATALAMDRSWSTIPHISASREIDASPLLDARRQLVELRAKRESATRTDDQQAPITPLALVVLAVAGALRRYPMMNAAIDLEAGTITVPERVNIGIAVATEHGLVVPVVADADQRSLASVAAEISRLSTAARNRTIGPGELAGGTHTITNYGSAGGHLAAPIIRPGEAAITGLGGIEERPIVIDGEVVARPTLPVVVCSDHRLIDGDVMSAFHADVCRSLSAPIGLLL